MYVLLKAFFDVFMFQQATCLDVTYWWEQFPVLMSIYILILFQVVLLNFLTTFGNLQLFVKGVY